MGEREGGKGCSSSLKYEEGGTPEPPRQDSPSLSPLTNRWAEGGALPTPGLRSAMCPDLRT